MRRCIVIGKPNVGKTLFALQFADYLGVRQVQVSYEDAAGKRWGQSFATPRAVEAMVGPEPHSTRCLQSLLVSLPAGKGVKRFQIVDTSGLMDGIHPDEAVRRAMAQTLASVRAAQVILHMVDASRAGQVGAVEALGEVDFQVAHFAQMRGGYLILANKMDLSPARQGLQQIRREFVGHGVVPVSALERWGFNEVKRFVGRHV